MTTRKFRATLLLGTVLLAGGTAVAVAQGSGLFDPAQLPTTKGVVAQYDLTPRGDVDGLILQDGTEVHFPPHLGLEVVALVRPGDAVTVHGLKARALPLVQAMSVTADGSNKTVVDNGPDHPPAPGGGFDGGPGDGHGPHHRPPPLQAGSPLQAQGVVKMALHGPRGELNGAMLEDGTLIHLPPPEAGRLSAQLQPGQTIAVRGQGVENSLGRSIAAQAFGPAADKLTPLAPPPPPPHGPGGPRGPGGDRPDAPPPPPR